ncbi:zinc transporter ZIP6-like isoform X1 [Carassius carassius]|uniref:zinc transporter ZIP6-like isoform X1 n=2 Tax=Carassius carassius TaxID=217509 RepID=UPI0028696345|nr:zinc transporter ZIP6-like isoform X1 [Carassius carassius]
MRCHVTTSKPMISSAFDTSLKSPDSILESPLFDSYKEVCNHIESDASMVGWWPHLFPVMSLTLLWACSLGAGSDCKSMAIETDGQMAEQAQQRHLQALFAKYGQNGSISLEGLFNLLKGVGLDRIRKVMVHHHGNGHNHTHEHDHTHVHVDKLTTRTHPVTRKKGGIDHNVEKSDPIPEAKPDPSSGKKSQSDDHHNLYMKMNQDLTTTLTTPSYITKSRRTNRSADYDLMQDHAPLNSTQRTQSNNTQQTEDTPVHTHDNHDLHGLDHTSLACQNASTILQSHGMTKEMGVSVKDFSYLCPALLLQIDSNSCLLHADDHPDHSHHHNHYHHRHNHQLHNHTNGRSPRNASIYIAWVGGFLSITLISLLALVGVVLIPLMNRVCFNFLLSFLVALAVGTLSGDAFLHLIPHSQGHHQHGHSEHHHHGEEVEEDSLRPVWTGLTALSGVYIMFLIEHFLTLGKMYKDKKQKVQKRVDLTTEVLEFEKLPSLEDDDVKTTDAAETNGGSACGLGVAEEEEVMLGAELYSDIDCENKCHSHFHDTVGQSDEQHHHHHDYHHILHHHHSQNHHPHTHTHRHTHSYSLQHFQQAGVATLAWMVIMGDGLHNFSDGLAIGAAFTEGLSSGLSTSVAVFCHELPHELGDFAVLLKAGMSVRQAILYNLLSALMGYLGMITGILIGHYAENVATWIFALTAGLFMYVALVDMVPEMLHNDANEAGFSHYGFFLLQNAGILLGFAIMLIIAVFEHRIQLDIGF